MDLREHHRLVDALHHHCQEVKTRCVLFIVGGGSLATGWLFGRPGASSWLLEARIPYGKKAMNELFGEKLPGTFCSEGTSLALSQLACQRAMKLSEDSLSPNIRYLGVGFTGALSSKEPKKGGSRGFLSTSRESGSSKSYSMKLESLGRDEEEKITSEAILVSIAEALGISTTLTFPHNTISTVQSPDNSVARLNDDLVSHMLFFPSGTLPLVNPFFQGLVFPGSFNPVHRGHLSLASAAMLRFPDMDFCFEISMLNADKPPLDTSVIYKRIDQFKQHKIVITKAPKFLDKAAILPGCTFVIGADTLIRLVDPKYYVDHLDMVAALSKIIHYYQCRFLVAGRLDRKSGVFLTYKEDVKRVIPLSLYEAGFYFLEEKEFRLDLSSTEIREGMASI